MNISLDLDLRPESLTNIQSLIKVINLTNNPVICFDHNKFKRLNNRCWRLLHNQSRDPSTSSMNQSHLHIPDEAIALSNHKPPRTLVLNSTTNTLFSHMSNLSLSKNHNSSHSSMSNIDEEELSELESDMKPKDENKNIFFIANSPSPPADQHPQQQQQQHHNTDSTPTVSAGDTCACDKKYDDINVETISVIPNRPKNLSRQDSLFSNNNQINFQKYSSSDMSDDGIEEEDESDSDSDSEGEVSEADVSKPTAEFTDNVPAANHKFRDQPVIIKTVSDSAKTKTSKAVKANETNGRKNSKSDDSEWMSVSSEDEKSEISYRPINFTKRVPPPVRQVSSDTITIPENSKKDNSPPLKPRSLLSGLFLNEMAKHHLHQHSDPLACASDNPSTPSSVKTSSNSVFSNSNRSFKPMLKRSSTTGIITVGQEESNGNSKIKIQKPSIMFQKKYTSMTDISKKYPHFHNKLIKNDILKDKEGNDISYSASRCIDCKKAKSMNPPSHVDEANYGNDDYESLAKQKSIVGISDFNVISDTSHVLETNALNSTSNNSHLNLNTFTRNNHSSTTTNSGSTTSSSNNNTSNNLSLSLLSSSLNKYSNSNTHSFKHVLSKSSLNLTNLFGSKKNNHKHSDNNDKLRKSNGVDPSPGNHSFGSSSFKSSSHSHNDAYNPDPKVTSLANSQEVELDSKELKEVIPTAIPGLVISTPVPTQIQSNDLKIEDDNEQSAVDSDGSKIKFSPNTTRKSMFDSELSLSLKDSIRIDYTLGKVPLPRKIIASDAQPLNTVDDDFSLDDYHSKGW